MSTRALSVCFGTIAAPPRRNPLAVCPAPGCTGQVKKIGALQKAMEMAGHRMDKAVDRVATKAGKRMDRVGGAMAKQTGAAKQKVAKIAEIAGPSGS